MGKRDYDSRSIRRRRGIRTSRYARSETATQARRRERRFRKQDMRRHQQESR